MCSKRPLPAAQRQSSEARRDPPGPLSSGRYLALVLLAWWMLPLGASFAVDVYTLAGHSMTVHDASTGMIKATVPIGNPNFAGPCGLAAGAGKVFVVENCGGSRILVLESPTYEIVNEILMPCCIADLALSSDASQLFALQNEIGGGAVLVWDIVAHREVSSLGVGSGARSLAVSIDASGNTSSSSGSGCSSAADHHQQPLGLVLLPLVLWFLRRGVFFLVVAMVLANGAPSFAQKGAIATDATMRVDFGPTVPLPAPSGPPLGYPVGQSGGGGVLSTMCHSEEGAAEGGGAQHQGLIHLRLAIEVRRNWTEYFPSMDALRNYIYGLYGTVNAIYKRDLGIEIKIGHIKTWATAEPTVYSQPPAGTASAILQRTHDYWQASLPRCPGTNCITRTHVQVVDFSPALADGVLGAAVVGSLCGSLSYSLVKLRSDGDLVGQDFYGRFNVEVAAHELGHVLGSIHSNCYVPPVHNCPTGEVTGCYSGPAECPATPDGIMSYCTQGGCAVAESFHPRGVEIISTFARSRAYPFRQARC